MATPTLTTPQRRLLEAIRAGATLRYSGWQQIAVTFAPVAHGVPDPQNYTAMQSTVYALRDRGLVTLDADGIHLAEGA